MTSSYLVGACTGRSAGIGTAQNAVHIACRLSKPIDKVRAVGHQTACCDKKTERIDRRQAVPSGECDDKITVLDRSTRQHDKATVRLACEGRYYTLDIGGILHRSGGQLDCQ